MQLNRTAFDRNTQAFERVMPARDREKADRETDEILVELKDLREESRAQRQALLAMVDRLPPAEAA
jgi:hypothetical protein